MAGCRRPECRAANSTYNKQYRVAQYGKGNRRVDAAPYANLVRDYVEAGWSRVQISQRTGVSETTITHLFAGRLIRLNPDVASGLNKLPVTPSTPDGRAFVDATGTVRRGRALFRIGHTVEAMAAELDLNPDTLSRILNRGDGQVLASTARGMDALYKKLRWTPGKLLGNRTRAIKRGWHGPLAWTDATINDPNAQPETGGPYKPIAKNGRDSMRRSEIWHLLSLGESIASIARQMGASEKYISDLISQGLDEPAYTTAA